MRPIEELKPLPDRSPIIVPDAVCEQLGEFLRSLKTGQITWNVKEGKIMSVDIRESIRV